MIFIIICYIILYTLHYKANVFLFFCCWLLFFVLGINEITAEKSSLREQWTKWSEPDGSSFRHLQIGELITWS